MQCNFKDICPKPPHVCEHDCAVTMPVLRLHSLRDYELEYEQRAVKEGVTRRMWQIQKPPSAGEAAWEEELNWRTC